MALDARLIAGSNTGYEHTIPNLNSGGGKIDVFAQEVGTGDDERIVKYVVVFLKNTTAGSVNIDIDSISLTNDTNNFYFLDGIETEDTAKSLIAHSLTTTLKPGDNAASGNRGFLNCTAVQNGFEFGADDGNGGEPVSRIEYIDGVDAIVANGIPALKYRTFIVSCEPNANTQSSSTVSVNITPNIGSTISFTLSLTGAGSKNQLQAFFNSADPDTTITGDSFQRPLMEVLSQSSQFANNIPNLTNPASPILASAFGNPFQYSEKIYIGQRGPDVYLRLTANQGAENGRLQIDTNQIEVLDKNLISTPSLPFDIVNIFTDVEAFSGTNLLNSNFNPILANGQSLFIGLRHQTISENLSPSLDGTVKVRVSYNQNSNMPLLDHSTGQEINTAEGLIKIQENSMFPFNQDSYNFNDSSVDCFFIQGTRGPSYGWNSLNAVQPHLTGTVTADTNNYDGGVLWQTNNLESSVETDNITINLSDDIKNVGLETNLLTESSALFTKEPGAGPDGYEMTIGGTIKDSTPVTNSITTKSISFKFNVPSSASQLNLGSVTDTNYGEALTQNIRSSKITLNLPNVTAGRLDYNTRNKRTYKNTLESVPDRGNPYVIKIDSQVETQAISTELLTPRADCVKPLPAELIIWHGSQYTTRHRGHVNDNAGNRAGIDKAIDASGSNTGWIGDGALEGVTSSDNASSGKAVMSSNWRSSLNGSIIEQQSKRFRYKSTQNSLIGLASSAQTPFYSTRDLNEFGHSLDKDSVVSDSVPATDQFKINSGCVAWSKINTDGSHEDANAHDKHHFHVATVETPKNAGNPFRMRVYNTNSSNGKFIKNPEETSNDHIYAHMKTLWMYNIGSKGLRITGASLTEWGKKVGGSNTGTWTAINPDLTNNEEFEHDATNNICSPIKVWIPQFNTANSSLTSGTAHAGDDKIIIVDTVYTDRTAIANTSPALLNGTHEFTQRFRKGSTYDAANSPYIMQPYRSEGIFTKGNNPFKTIPIQVFADATNFVESSTSNEDGVMPNNTMYRVKLTVKYVHEGSNTTSDLDIYSAISDDGSASGSLISGITEEEVTLWLTMKLESSAGTLELVDEDNNSITDGSIISLGNITIE